MEPTRPTMRVLLATMLAEGHAPQPDDPRLRLIQPLVSKRRISSNVTVVGDHTETHLAVESIALNGVKHVTAALLRETETAQASERVLTIHTQMFASPRDIVPELTDVRTIIVDHIQGVSEPSGRWEDIFITLVDKSGVHRSPVARAKTLP
jgi:hypothetical protein